MPLSNEELDTVAQLILAIGWTGTVDPQSPLNEYIASATVAVSSDGDRLFVTANDLWADVQYQADIAAEVQEINDLQNAQRPYIWQNKKYRRKLLAVQQYWHQEQAIVSQVSAFTGVDEGSIILLLNPLGHLDRNFHAEMQLLYIHEDNSVPMNPRYIGVSKPCCLLCASVLLSLGIGFAGTHGDLAQGWQAPLEVMQRDEFVYLRA